MCGIYGITEKNFNIISKNINTCSHRGPDGSSIWLNDKITLGHNLLSITSNPEDGKQPWITENKNVLVYNGEVFNYYEIRDKFKNKFFPKTKCDTELLVWLLENFNYIKVIDEILDSMHAFAFYNAAKEELILSRDHAGIKPLYYAELPCGIVFSSEIKSLIPLVKSSNTIEKLAFACTSFIGSNLLRQTVFKGINKVLPGETLIYSIIKKKFVSNHRTIIKPLSNNKLDLEEFRFETSRAIKQSTLGLRQFGMFLSGGLDSSLIALELKNNLQQLNTFTNFMEPNVKTNLENHNSDASTAKKFTNDFNMNHHEIKITPQILSDSWDDAITYMEEPRYNWNMPMYYYTNKMLAKYGTVITMAGDIGDELLGGYPNYFFKKNIKLKPKNWEEFVWIWMAKLASPIKLNMKFSQEDLHALLCQTLPQDLWNPDDIANSSMALDCITTVSEDFFSRNDKYGMAFSMEGRFPFASKRFMAYCLNINSDYKIGNTSVDTKLPIKLAYKEILPDYITKKSKTGWTVPIMHWLTNNLTLQNKYKSIVKQQDGISELISEENYSVDKSQMISKPRIISWMMRSWAQQYEMSI